jgi:hypothetical protein
MGTRLLLSLFLFSAIGYGEVAKSPESAVPSAGPSSVASSPFSGMPKGLDARNQERRNTEADNVCLNIHAFIFKTDDDRVPTLVRETTCMPVTGGTKKVKGEMQPKLIPATGENHF